MQRFLVVMLLCAFPFAAQAGANSPVVIEFFGENNCIQDTDAQEDLKEILQNERNVFLVNCRKLPSKDGDIRAFSHKFCVDRERAYRKFFRSTQFYNLNWMLVNGKWDANYKDIMPAVKMGRHDGVREISMQLDGDTINISIPEIVSKAGFGEMYLYAYAPSTGEETIFVDPDVELTGKMREDLALEKSVPFVTKVKSSQIYVRPILGMEHVGTWRGQKMEFSVPTRDVASMTRYYYDDLSYILVLHDGGFTGPVLGVGEAMSMAEANNSLPNSVAPNIELRSFVKEDLISIQ